MWSVIITVYEPKYTSVFMQCHYKYRFRQSSNGFNAFGAPSHSLLAQQPLQQACWACALPLRSCHCGQTVYCEHICCCI